MVYYRIPGLAVRAAVRPRGRQRGHEADLDARVLREAAEERGAAPGVRLLRQDADAPRGAEPQGRAGLQHDLHHALRVLRGHLEGGLHLRERQPVRDEALELRRGLGLREEGSRLLEEQRRAVHVDDAYLLHAGLI